MIRLQKVAGDLAEAINTEKMEKGHGGVGVISGIFETKSKLLAAQKEFHQALMEIGCSAEDAVKTRAKFEAITKQQCQRHAGL